MKLVRWCPHPLFCIEWSPSFPWAIHVCSLYAGAECVNAIKEATTQVDSWLGNKNTWSMAERIFKYVTIVIEVVLIIHVACMHTSPTSTISVAVT